MPIRIQADLPARQTLENENIFVMTEQRAATQDIRPLKIAIVNLMPTKEATETQLLRLLGNTPLQIDISLVRMKGHVSKNTSQEHLERFYISSDELCRHKYDGMIITGAPVEQLAFEDVDYWDELCSIMNFAHDNAFCTLYICWGAQAGLYHWYKIQKHIMEKKMFGVFANRRIVATDPLLRGFDDTFYVPTSRHTTVSTADILKNENLVLLADSDVSGVTIVKSRNNREIFMTGHLEYDADTLANEYWRDRNKGLAIDFPKNYFPNDDPKNAPVSFWRSTAHLFYSNWLNYYVYQETPFNYV